MRFDFAISFAGPEREIARTLARKLQEAGLSIFFDELFEHEMLGKDGADYLNEVFFAQSSCCIALVSRAYEERAWAQLERRAAQARELNEQMPGFLIPVLCDNERPPWLLPTRIFFDLRQRPLKVLAQILVKRAFSFPGGSYKLAAQFDGLLGGDSVSVSNVFGTLDFLVWSTYEPSPSRRPIRLSRQCASREWHTTQIPVMARGKHIILSGGVLVVVPERSTDPVQIVSLQAGRSAEILVPRRRKWVSLTDCKFSGTALLLSYCGGDVWSVDLQAHHAVEIQQGCDEVMYAYSDWFNDRVIVTGHDQSNEMTIHDYHSKAVVAKMCAEEPATAIACFPTLGRVLVGGESFVTVYSYPEWKLQYRHELIQGVFDLCCARERPLYGFTSGMPFSGNVLELWDASTGLRVLKERSTREGGWSSFALSKDGSTLAVVVGRNTVNIYEASAARSAQQGAAAYRKAAAPLSGG